MNTLLFQLIILQTLNCQALNNLYLCLSCSIFVLQSQLTAFSFVPMTKIKREPCGGWMIVLFMVVSLLLDVPIGCVSYSIQNVSFVFQL